MKTTRRGFFLATAGMGGAAFAGGCASLGPAPGSARLRLSYRPWTARLRDVFTIAGSSRSETPIVFTEVEYGGVVGYGEASMPPYLGESHESVLAFLAKVDLGRFANPFDLETILAEVDAIAPGNPAAKAAVDIALHDLVGKLMGQPLYNLWGFPAGQAPLTSFTIGIDAPEVVRRKVREAKGFGLLKVKLGRGTDREMIDAVRAESDVPLIVDVNQGWRDRERALDEIRWLAGQGVLLVEQPLPKETIADMAWLTERSPLPTIGDEAVQRLPDVAKAKGVYSGINIKLMKCTGLREAHKMLILARALGLKVLLGCMTETSCGISAASHLSPMVDWADLDGALLLAEDPFAGTRVEAGRLVLSEVPGTGVRPTNRK